MSNLVCCYTLYMSITLLLIDKQRCHMAYNKYNSITQSESPIGYRMIYLIFRPMSEKNYN